jgi:hypothetical protein
MHLSNVPGSDVVEDSVVPEVCLLQCLALELKVDTLRIFFNLQEAVSGNPRPGRFAHGKETGYPVQDAGWA